MAEVRENLGVLAVCCVLAYHYMYQRVLEHVEESYAPIST